MRGLITVAFVCTTALTAGVVVPNGPWQTVNTPVQVAGEKIINNTAATNTAYWNNVSDDTSNGAECPNVGCYLTNSSAYPAGLGGVANSPALANPVFLGTNSGDAVSFNFQGDTEGDIKLLVEVAGLEGLNWFGWYDTSLNPDVVGSQFNTTNHAANKWGVIFPGSSSDGSTVTSALITIAPGSSFGFWFLPGFDNDLELTPGAPGNPAYPAISTIANKLNSGTAFYTENGKNQNGEAGKQYFTLFARSATAASNPPVTFWMGMEDKTDFDYNDMVVSFTVVPEPGFYGALALGLSGLYMAFRRRKA